MLWRGARHRCPWCNGRGAFFSGWFRKHDACQTCGISWQRGYEGFELGAVTINTMVTFGVLIVGLVIGVVTTTPDIPVVPLVAGLGVAAIVLPVVIYPITYTVWQAVDLAMHPPEPTDPGIPKPSL